MVGIALDGDIGRLRAGDTLLWFPAHRTRAAVGAATLSDGSLMAWTDWRANRLVDALAKSAARWRSMPASVARPTASSR